MSYSVRQALQSDVEVIASFTTDTFAWGDYVADELPSWLADADGLVLVAATSDDKPVAVSRTVMLSSREAWLHGARVHQSYRRQGIGRTLNEAGCEWAKEKGAVVARLMVEDWNSAARSQVAALGYRRSAEWMSAVIELGTEVLPQTNGGRRVPGEERLTPGRSSEVDVAWMSWAVSDSARIGRELYPVGWHFRRMRPDDLAAAASRRELWQCPSGWVIAMADDQDAMLVPWLSTTDIDAARMIRAVIDLADGTRSERVRVLSPKLPWMSEALERAGFVIEPSAIYTKPLL